MLASAAHTVRLYLYTSDGGSDQMKYKRLMHRMVLDHPTVWFIPSSCFFHIYQLVVKATLTAADSWVVCGSRRRARLTFPAAPGGRLAVLAL